MCAAGMNDVGEGRPNGERNGVTAGRDCRSKGSRHRPAKGRRIPAGKGFREADSMCAAGKNEVHEVGRTKGQLP